MTISMKSVQSSSISEIGYRRRTLHVKFNSGRIYEFKKVPRAVYDDFLKAESKGDFFNHEIRKNFPEKEIS